MTQNETGTAGWLDDTELPEGFFDDLPRPLYWRVLILPAKPKERSKGGIILAQQNQEAQEILNYIGKIVAVGPAAGVHERLGGDGKAPSADFPKIGDWVMYGRYAGQVILHKGKTLRVINDDEILGIVPNPETLQVSV